MSGGIDRVGFNPSGDLLSDQCIDKECALQLAVQRGDLKTAKSFILEKVAVNEEEFYNFIYDHEAAIKKMCSHEETPLEIGLLLSSPLVAGAILDQLSLEEGVQGIQLLWNEYQDLRPWITAHLVNAQSLGGTLLHSCTQDNRLDEIKVLMDMGADLEILDECGFSVIFLAIDESTPEIAEFLIGRGARLTASIDELRLDHLHLGDTPLHAAVRLYKPEMVPLLVTSGADIHAKNQSGKTPLHLAAQDGQLDMVTFLLNKGADRDAVDAKDRTPLELARLREKHNIVAHLQQQS